MIDATTADAQRLEEIHQRTKDAHKMVSDLCHGRRDWMMSIPAREGYDPDLVIGAALRDNDALLAIIDKQTVVVEAARKVLDAHGMDSRELCEMDVALSALEQ